MKRVADSENNYCVFSDQINKENNYECQIMFTDGKDNDYQIINFRNGPQSIALLDITYAITLKTNPFTKVLLSDDEKERIKIYHRAYQWSIANNQVRRPTDEALLAIYKKFRLNRNITDEEEILLQRWLSFDITDQAEIFDAQAKWQLDNAGNANKEEWKLTRKIWFARSNEDLNITHSAGQGYHLLSIFYSRKFPTLFELIKYADLPKEITEATAREWLIIKLENTARSYARAAQKLYDTGRTALLPVLIAQFQAFIKEALICQIVDRQAILAKVYYEILIYFPDIQFLDILIAEGLDLLYKIYPLNELRIPTVTDRHLCRFATRRILDLADAASTLVEGNLANPTKVFALHLFNQLAERTDLDSLKRANQAILISISIPEVSENDATFGKIIDEIKDLYRLKDDELKKAKEKLKNETNNYYQKNSYEPVGKSLNAGNNG